jgi:hypothetical protein
MDIISSGLEALKLALGLAKDATSKSDREAYNDAIKSHNKRCQEFFDALVSGNGSIASILADSLPAYQTSTGAEQQARLVHLRADIPARDIYALYCAASGQRLIADLKDIGEFKEDET